MSGDRALRMAVPIRARNARPRRFARKTAEKAPGGGDLRAGDPAARRPRIHAGEKWKRPANRKILRQVRPLRRFEYSGRCTHGIAPEVLASMRLAAPRSLVTDRNAGVSGWPAGHEQKGFRPCRAFSGRRPPSRGRRVHPPSSSLLFEARRRAACSRGAADRRRRPSARKRLPWGSVGPFSRRQQVGATWRGRHPASRYVPSSAFLPPSTVCSPICLAGLFHPAAAKGSRPSGVCPSRGAVPGFPGPCPRAVRRSLPAVARSGMPCAGFRALLPASSAVTSDDRLKRPRLRAPLGLLLLRVLPLRAAAACAASAPDLAPQRTRCDRSTACFRLGARLAWNQATDPHEVSGLNSAASRNTAARGHLPTVDLPARRTPGNLARPMPGRKRCRIRSLRRPPLSRDWTPAVCRLSAGVWAPSARRWAPRSRVSTDQSPDGSGR